MPQIELKGITKAYNKGTLLFDTLEASFNNQELTVILGPSGCGKSTLLRVIAGLENIEQGAVLFDQQDFTKVPAKSRSVGMVFQNYSLYPHLTVEKNLLFPLRLKKMARAEKNALLQKTAELLQIGKLLKKYPKELSGGQKQRIAIGRCLMRNPKVYLFDEPLSNIDQRLREKLRKEIRALHDNQKWTTIFVTHDQAEAMSLGDNLVLMQNGLVVQTGRPEELYYNPNSLFTATFIGSPEINRAEVNCERDKVIIQGLGTYKGLHIPPMAGRGTMAIRPDALVFEPLAEDYLEWEVEIVQQQFYGSRYHLQLKVGELLWVADVASLPAKLRLKLYTPEHQIFWFDGRGKRMGITERA